MKMTWELGPVWTIFLSCMEEVLARMLQTTWSGIRAHNGKIALSKVGSRVLGITLASPTYCGPHV